MVSCRCREPGQYYCPREVEALYTLAGSLLSRPELGSVSSPLRRWCEAFGPFRRKLWSPCAKTVG